MPDLTRIAQLRARAEALRTAAEQAEDAWMDEVMAAVEAGATWTAVARRSGMARTTVMSRAAVYRQSKAG